VTEIVVTFDLSSSPKTPPTTKTKAIAVACSTVSEFALLLATVKIKLQYFEPLRRIYLTVLNH
jgi:hypothetical protein